MFRVNVEGTVLALDDAGLFDLLYDIKALMRDAVIVRCRGGYVVDSIATRSSVKVNVTEIAPLALAGVA